MGIFPIPIAIGRDSGFASKIGMVGQSDSTHSYSWWSNTSRLHTKDREINILASRSAQQWKQQ